MSVCIVNRTLSKYVGACLLVVGCKPTLWIRKLIHRFFVVRRYVVLASGVAVARLIPENLGGAEGTAPPELAEPRQHYRYSTRFLRAPCKT